MSERLKQMVKSEAERRVKNLLLVEQMLAQHFGGNNFFKNFKYNFVRVRIVNIIVC